MTAQYLVQLCLFFALVSPMASLSVGNLSTGLMRFKREETTGRKDDDRDQLVYSTKTMLLSLSFKYLSSGNASAEQFSTVFQENRYIINAFDISFEDGLAFYGIDELFARPIGTKPNSLGYTGKHNTGIKFEHHFAIDWLDHNVLLYRDNAIRLVSLTKSRFTRQIYNGSRKVRNLLVSDKGLFFAWIENENNIHRAAKDGSEHSRVRTEKSKIFCMTLDHSTSRFFYYIGGTGFTNQRSIRIGKRKPKPDGEVENEEENGTEDENENEKSTKAPKKKKQLYYFVLYSIDFEGRYSPEREGSVKVGGFKSEPVQVAKYRDSVFVILQDRMDDSGDVKYRLGQVMRTGHFEEIVVNPNWRITWVMMASKKPPGIDMCGPGGRCPYLCVHMTQEKANCLCKDNLPGCVDFAVTASPRRTSTAKGPASLQAEHLWVAGLLLVLVPIFGALTYFLCVHYYEEQAELNHNETSESESTLFNNKNSKSMRKGQVKFNARSRQTMKTPGTPSKAKDGTPWNAMVSWVGLGSADMSDSTLEKVVSPLRKIKKKHQQSSQSSSSVSKTPQKLLSKKNRKLPRSRYCKEGTASLDTILCDNESEVKKKKKSKSRSKTPKGESKKKKKTPRKGARHKQT